MNLTKRLKGLLDYEPINFGHIRIPFSYFKSSDAEATLKDMESRFKADKIIVAYQVKEHVFVITKSDLLDNVYIKNTTVTKKIKKDAEEYLKYKIKEWMRTLYKGDKTGDDLSMYMYNAFNALAKRLR